MIIDLTKAKLVGAEVSSVLTLGYRLTDKPGSPVIRMPGGQPVWTPEVRLHFETRGGQAWKTYHPARRD